MKQKEFLLIVLLYIIVAIAAFFCYKKLFPENGNNGNDGNGSGNDTPGSQNEVIKVGDKVQCVGSIALRKSAKIDNGFIDNIVASDAKGYLGEVLAKSTDEDGNIWCKIKLETPVYEWLMEYTEVYALESEITKK
ncbi:MAG: hypothetical protein MJ198_05100 [Bacteroidales bacterium]|nr:hypothetical protein [Bacteroidales bacterium]